MAWRNVLNALASQIAPLAPLDQIAALAPLAAPAPPLPPGEHRYSSGLRYDDNPGLRAAGGATTADVNS